MPAQVLQDRPIYDTSSFLNLTQLEEAASVKHSTTLWLQITPPRALTLQPQHAGAWQLSERTLSWIMVLSMLDTMSGAMVSWGMGLMTICTS